MKIVSYQSLVLYIVLELVDPQLLRNEIPDRTIRSAEGPGTGRNRRTVCDRECTCQLPAVECRRRNLRSIPLPFPRGVEKIVIAENPLNTIKQNSFYKQEFSTVTDLLLEDNEISTLETRGFNGLSNVRQLSIKGNKIKSVDEMAFYGLRSLETLSISSNQLKELNPMAFSFGMGIKTIILNDNKLQSLSSDLFDALPSLETLSLGGNPWKCDCNLLGLYVWLQFGNTALREPDAECAKPPSVQGKKLNTFTNNDMQTACLEDDGEEDEEDIDEKIDEACAEHNSTEVVDICYISDTVFANLGGKVCLYCAATVDPGEIERNLAEATGADLTLHWIAPAPDEDKSNETSGDTICFDKVKSSDGGVYICEASFGNATDQREVEIIINDLANKVGIGLAIFFGTALIVVLLLLLRWWLKETRVE